MSDLEKLKNMEEKNWVAVSENYSTRRYMVPFNDKRLLLWIHVKCDRWYDANTLLNKYELYSPELVGLEIRTGVFRCLRIFDSCRPVGCGTYRYVSMEVEDGEMSARCIEGFSMHEEGVIQAFRFMKHFGRMKNWEEYDQMRNLARSLGSSVAEMDDMLNEDLQGTGVFLI